MNGLKQIRTQCDFSVTDVAKKLGVSKQAVSSWENGKKEIPEARRRQLALLFGVDVSVFGDSREFPGKVRRLSYSEEFIQRKEEQKLLEERIHRTIDGAENLNIRDQISNINRGLLLYRRFIDVINLLNAQKYTDRKDYFARVLEVLDGMILAMGGQINLHKDVESGLYNEKRENVEKAKDTFEALSRSAGSNARQDMQIMFPTSSLDGLWK